MSSDPDTPEWTDAEIARGRPGAEVLPPSFVSALKRERTRPSQEGVAVEEQITLRLDKLALDRLRAGGPGWRARINEAVRKAAGL